MQERTQTAAVLDLARARMERLEAEELRALGAATGHQLPIELAQRVERLRAERLMLAAGELPPVA